MCKIVISGRSSYTSCGYCWGKIGNIWVIPVYVLVFLWVLKKWLLWQCVHVYEMVSWYDEHVGCGWQFGLYFWVKGKGIHTIGIWKIESVHLSRWLFLGKNKINDSWSAFIINSWLFLFFFQQSAHQMELQDGGAKFEKGRIQVLQQERVYIQKKTFTKWCNSFLEKVGFLYTQTPNFHPLPPSTPSLTHSLSHPH